MINDLLDFGRLGADNLVLNCIKIDLSNIFEEIIDLFEL